MTKAVRLNFGSKQEFHLFRELGKGNIRWEDISPSKKKMLYQSPYDITDVVDSKKIHEYEIKMGLKGELSPSGLERGKVLAKRIARQTPIARLTGGRFGEIAGD